MLIVKTIVITFNVIKLLFVMLLVLTSVKICITAVTLKSRPNCCLLCLRCQQAMYSPQCSCWLALFADECRRLCCLLLIIPLCLLLSLKHFTFSVSLLLLKPGQSVESVELRFGVLMISVTGSYVHLMTLSQLLGFCGV